MPSLLILHLDVAKLRSDGLHLAGPALFASTWAAHGLGADVQMVDATDQQDLCQRLGKLVEQRRKFDVMVIVGHSNAEGIKIAADQFVGWEAFAAYLHPFGPRRLLLVACKAGVWPAAKVLFRKLPKLRRIYASPVNVSKDLGELIVALAPLVVHTKAPSERQVLLARGLVVALTGGQLQQWLRGDRDNPEEGLIRDFAAKALDPLARQVPKLIRSLLRE